MLPVDTADWVEAVSLEVLSLDTVLPEVVSTENELLSVKEVSELSEEREVTESVSEAEENDVNDVLSESLEILAADESVEMLTSELVVKVVNDWKPAESVVSNEVIKLIVMVGSEAVEVCETTDSVDAVDKPDSVDAVEKPDSVDAVVRSEVTPETDSVLLEKAESVDSVVKAELKVDGVSVPLEIVDSPEFVVLINVSRSSEVDPDSLADEADSD